MFQVCAKDISGNRSVIVRFDFESAVTSRYDRREIAAAIAAYMSVDNQPMYLEKGVFDAPCHGRLHVLQRQ